MPRFCPASLQEVKNTLIRSIRSLPPDKSVKDPSRDFTRPKKLSVYDTMFAVIAMGGGSSDNEICSVFKDSDNPATLSALIQRRAQLKDSAFSDLFYSFTGVCPVSFHPTLRDPEICDVDGTAINIIYNNKDKSSFIERKDGKGHNQLHCVAVFNASTGYFIDGVIQNAHDKNENLAFTTMADRAAGNSRARLYIGDRLFSSYNNMAHCVENDTCFLFRCKDITSSTSIFASLDIDLSKGQEFDIDVRIILSHLPEKKVRQMHPELWDNNRYVIFRYIGKDRTFDYLSEEKPVYTMHVRAIRFRLPQKINRDVDDLTKAAAEDRPDIQMQSGEKESGPEKEPLQGDENVSGVEESSKESSKESPNKENYELLVTNLSRDYFNTERVKDLYWRRWPIELTFRTLKWAISLSYTHSRKKEYIHQEIWARLILFNFINACVSLVTVTRKEKNKYEYKINIVKAVHSCRQFLIGYFSEEKAWNCIRRRLTPIRPDRIFPRNIKPQGAKTFLYRGC